MKSASCSAQEPIVKAALGKDWDLLPDILRRNFDLRPGTNSEVRLTGVMYEISYSRLARFFIYAGQLFGALVPYQGTNIPIRIDIRTHMSDLHFMYWQRVHFFTENPEYIFSSRMEYLEPSLVGQNVHVYRPVLNCIRLAQSTKVH